MTPTERYVKTLTRLKPGELGLLRSHAGQGIDESVEAFDLFTGLWWRLRQKSEKTPRRSVAWLIAKLYAFRPIAHAAGKRLAGQLWLCRPRDDKSGKSFQDKYDRMLVSPRGEIEPYLQWAIALLDSNGKELDWVKLTNDLSIWERESTRLKWAEEFLNTNQGESSC